MKKSKQGIATIGLIFITFLAAIQYVFLRNVPDSVSTFSFVFITNVIGLVIIGLFRFKKAFSLDNRTLKKGVLFALELTGFNFFVLLGSKNMDAVIVSSVVSLYFVFVTPLLIMLKRKTNFFSAIASVIAIIALILMFGADTDTLFSSFNVIYLIIADVCFAAYVVSVSILGENEDSTKLTFSQMLFSSIFAFIGWAVEVFLKGGSLSLPMDFDFWLSAIFIGVFIRAVYGLIQISSQKHVSALKASLIFASEIIITLITNPFLCRFLGIEYTPATTFQIIGGVLFIIATLMIDDGIMAKVGYEDVADIDEEGPDGIIIHRVSVSKKVILTTLWFSLVTLVLSTIICLSAIHFIRENAISNSIDLGESASAESSTALMHQLETKITNQAEDKTLLAEERLQDYSDAIKSAAAYAHSLYLNKESYPLKEVFPPDSKNEGKWVMQRTLANEDVEYDEELQAESMLLGNMVDIFHSIKEANTNITTIYMGTNTGLLVSYDTLSDSDAGYYEYRESEWYTDSNYILGDGGGFAFTDTYQDSFGRGLMITVYSPFTDRNGKFKGCVAMDILMSDINESMVNDGIESPSEAVLIDDEGNFIAGKDIDPASEEMGSIFDEGKNDILKEAGETILKESTGVVRSGTGREGYYVAFSTIKSTGWKLCILSPVSEVVRPAQVIKENIDQNTDNVVETVMAGILVVIQSCLVLIALILIIVTLIAGKISKKISDPLKQLETDVKNISGGNLDSRTQVNTNDEIGSLARSFNSMTDSLQKYIKDLKEVTAKEERIAGELSVATDIQASMLPRDFEEFKKDHTEFDLFASMTPAKEVGGDFYDFFLIDDDHVGLVMADVSGKGVPAALLMVITKTLLKNRALMGGTPAEIMTYVNDQLCENNDAGYFVTVWFAIVEISTGKGLAVNAGHEHPALRRANGDFELITYRHSPPVATMEGMRFREHEFEIHPGDTLFVYTDGVAEATNANNELFTEERMIEALNVNPNASPKELLDNVNNAINAFVLEAPQFDDITMMGIAWNGLLGMRTYTSNAELGIGVSAPVEEEPVAEEVPVEDDIVIREITDEPEVEPAVEIPAAAPIEPVVVAPIEEPVYEEPVVEPVVEEPVAAPVYEEPVVEESVAAPVFETPVVETPEAPAVEEPVAEEQDDIDISDITIDMFSNFAPFEKTEEAPAETSDETSSNGTPYVCEKCGATFYGLGEYMQHTKEHSLNSLF